MRRVIATLGLVACLAGCSAGGSGDGVSLLTDDGSRTCYAGGENGPTGQLVVDATYGTNLDGHPVIWPDGFTARRAGSEVEVLDAAGTVVATTGRRYHVSSAPVASEEARRLMESAGAISAAVGCGSPWDFVDCTEPGPSVAYCEGRRSNGRAAPTVSSRPGDADADVRYTLGRTRAISSAG